MGRASSKLFILLVAISVTTVAQAECFRSVKEMKTNNIKRRWQETTANDGKPLMISIGDSSDGLIFSAKKAGVLWLTGDVSACRTEGAVDITMRNTKATSDVPALTRLALPATLSARIVSDKLKLAGGGWSGIFVGR
jgi:hypothetical protein